MKKNVDFDKSFTDDWRTPSFFYQHLMDLGYIDPCPYKSTINGLNINYFKKRIFVNPPYSDISTWVDWCIAQYHNGCDILLLIPSRTDTKYFHKLLDYTPLIYFIKGRLHFNDADKGAPFPSILVYISKYNLMPLYLSINNNNLCNIKI